MIEEQNKALVRRWFDQVWNQGNIDAIYEILAPDGVAYNLPSQQEAGVTGPDEFKPLVEKFRGALPDIHITIEDLIAEDDRVMARCTVRGTHLGDSLGFPPSGNQVEFSGIALVRIRDNKFFEGWNHFDFMMMFQQMGVLAGQE